LLCHQGIPRAEGLGELFFWRLELAGRIRFKLVAKWN